jgi:hypothetical protein
VFILKKSNIMKRLLGFGLVTFALLLTGKAFGQGFVETMEGEGLSALYGNECILILRSGEEVHGTYSENFQELYSDCPEMSSHFQGGKTRWNDVALHVFVYDQLCK